VLVENGAELSGVRIFPTRCGRRLADAEDDIRVGIDSLAVSPRLQASMDERDQAYQQFEKDQ
jgi:hypothetical protein